MYQEEYKEYIRYVAVPWTPLFLSERSFTPRIAIFQLWLFFSQYFSLSECVSLSMKWLQVNSLFSQQRGSQHANVKPLRSSQHRCWKEMIYLLAIGSCTSTSVWELLQVTVPVFSLITRAQRSFDIYQHPSILAWIQMPISQNSLHEQYVDRYIDFLSFFLFWQNAFVAEKPIYQKHFGGEPRWHQVSLTELCFEVSIKTNWYYQKRKYIFFVVWNYFYFHYTA